jgi:hypothetical protein
VRETHSLLQQMQFSMIINNKWCQLLFLIVQIATAIVVTSGQGQSQPVTLDLSPLQESLSTNATITHITSTDRANYSTECVLQKGSDELAASANGICMQTYYCGWEFCEPSNDPEHYNLPSVTIDVRTESDISELFKYIHVNKVKIASSERHHNRNDENSQYSSVAVKTSGHSYQGSSTGKNSLLIWMYHFQKDEKVKTSYKSELEIQQASTRVSISIHTSHSSLLASF